LADDINRVQYYVSALTGNDTNVGDESEPFASLAAALAAASNATSNPDNAVEINIAAGVYTGVENVGLVYTTDTLIQYYAAEDVNATTVDFACENPLTDFYFNAANNFVIDGNDNDENIVFNIYNCFTGIYFDNVLPINVTYNDYYLHVLYTNFGSNVVGVASSNVYEVLVQDSGFNGTTTFAIQASGNGTGGAGFSQVEIDRVTFFNAGAIAVDNFDTGKIEDVTVSVSNIGAFILADGAWDIEGLTVNETSTLLEGGALSLQNANVTLKNSDFTNCGASAGGAIYFKTVDASLTSVTFTDCYCTGITCTGGAYAHQNSLLTTSSLSDLTFTGNNASYGAGIELSGTILGYDVTGLVFNDNTAIYNGSCIDCCAGLGCTGFTLNVTDADTIEGSGNVGGVNITCTVVEDSSFSTVIDNSVESITPADNDDDNNYWWVWIIVIFVVAAIIAIIVGAVGFFLYQKKKKGEYAAVD